MKRLIIVSICLLATMTHLSGCRDLSLPPPGSYSEILLVLEGGKQSPYLGLVMESIGRELDFYASQEKQFEVSVISAETFTSSPMVKNILLVGTIDPSTKIGRDIASLAGEDGLREVAEGGGAVLEREHVPAPGQLTLIVTARTESELLRVLTERGAGIPDAIEASGRRRLRAFMLDYLDADLARYLFRAYGFTLEIPGFYNLHSESQEPPGIELLREDPALSLGVFWTEWDHEPGPADESALFGLRANYVYRRYDGDAMDSTRVAFSGTRLGRHRAYAMEGYWFSTTATAGGCYKTFFIYDEAGTLLWAIDALVFAPGKPKHPLFRELVSIAETFRYD
ncbi:MAG: DUF4837 family protein [Chitinivibrionia bacterium]|nr:DUF4837 family protein [Chitinivibrionia bacterium]